jgi:plasmid maintenance system killer protein
MSQFVIEGSFLESAFQAPKELGRKIWKALHLLATNPRHPGLHLENLQGDAFGLQSVRVDDKYRIIISPSAPAATLLYVGVHDDAYKFAGRVRAPKGPMINDIDGLYKLAMLETASASLADKVVRDLLIHTHKYLPLASFLMNQALNGHSVQLQFKQIEQLIKAPFPKSARKYRAWWANEKKGGRHVQANAWVSIGWRVFSVDLKTEAVTFARIEESNEPQIR